MITTPKAGHDSDMSQLIMCPRMSYCGHSPCFHSVQCAGTWWAGHARGHRGAFDRRTRAGETATALGVVGDHPSTAERVCACLSEQQQVDAAGGAHVVGHLRTSCPSEFLVFLPKNFARCASISLMRTSPIPSMSWSALRVRARSLRLLSTLARSRRADCSLRKAIGTPDAGPDSGAAGTAHGFLRLLAQCNRLHRVHAVWLPIGRGRIRSGLDLEPLRLTRLAGRHRTDPYAGMRNVCPEFTNWSRPIERNPSKESAAIPSSTPPLCSSSFAWPGKQRTPAARAVLWYERRAPHYISSRNGAITLEGWRALPTRTFL